MSSNYPVGVTGADIEAAWGVQSAEEADAANARMAELEDMAEQEARTNAGEFQDWCVDVVDPSDMALLLSYAAQTDQHNFNTWRDKLLIDYRQYRVNQEGV